MQSRLSYYIHSLNKPKYILYINLSSIFKILALMSFYSTYVLLSIIFYRAFILDILNQVGSK